MYDINIGNKVYVSSLMDKMVELMKKYGVKANGHGATGSDAKDKDGNTVFHLYGNSQYNDICEVRTSCLMYVINPHAGHFYSVNKEKTARLTIVPIHGQEIPKNEIKDMERILRESL